MDEKPIVVLTTASPEIAGEIARTLVERHLAACVNMSGVRSCYRWEGEFCDEEEVLLIIKTVEGKADAVTDAILAIHRYELPEILVFPVASGYGPYLQWLIGETTE